MMCHDRWSLHADDVDAAPPAPDAADEPGSATGGWLLWLGD